MNSPLWRLQCSFESFYLNSSVKKRIIFSDSLSCFCIDNNLVKRKKLRTIIVFMHFCRAMGFLQTHVCSDSLTNFPPIRHPFSQCCERFVIDRCSLLVISL